MKWEYKVVQFPAWAEDAEEKLNLLGEQGWELVSAMPLGEIDDEMITLYLKRQVAPLK